MAVLPRAGLADRCRLLRARRADRDGRRGARHAQARRLGPQPDQLVHRPARISSGSTDTSPEVNGGATLLLDVALEWYARQDPDGGVLLPTGVVRFKALRAGILPNLEKARAGASQQMWTEVERLRGEWGYVTPTTG